MTLLQSPPIPSGTIVAAASARGATKTSGTAPASSRAASSSASRWPGRWQADPS